MGLPPLTPEQRAAALEKAAMIRRERDEVAALLSGVTTLAEVFEAAQSSDAIGKMKISVFLERLPGVGKVRAGQIMERFKIRLGQRVRDLSAAQRAALEREYAGITLRRQAPEAGLLIDLSLQVERGGYQRVGGPEVFQLRVPWTAEGEVRQALRDAGAATLPDMAGVLGIT